MRKHSTATKETTTMKHTALSVLLVGVLPATTFQAEPTGHIPNLPGLQFDNNGKLSITVLSDLHFGERE